MPSQTADPVIQIIYRNKKNVVFAFLSCRPTGHLCRTAKTAKPGASQEELEKQFAETMSGATLVGRFTVIEDKTEQPLKEDRYTLGTVKKLPNGLWSFETRIQYGDHDVKVPLALEVKWAGDTPVITLTDVLVPGLGTFTSRVLVYRGWYAGTWSGANHGGHMFGRIVHGDEAKALPAHEAGHALLHRESSVVPVVEDPWRG